MDYSDQELFELFRDGANKHYTFNLLVKKYQKRLYWHIRKIVLTHSDTDDVLQNTFIKVWKGLPDFRQDSKLYTWLYRIATNEALIFLRKKRRASFFSFDDFAGTQIKNLQQDAYYDGDEMQLEFQRALQKLPEKQKLVFNMKYFDEMKYEDMTEILETSVGALKASYHHAVMKIKKSIQND